MACRSPAALSGAPTITADLLASYGFAEQTRGVQFSVAAGAAESVASAVDLLTIGAPTTSANAFPFGGAFSGFAGTRYQQAYAASQFATVGPSLIRTVQFVGGFGVLPTTSYTFSLSTISAGINDLSNSNFNGNRGADNTLFASVPLSGPAPATLTINGTTPFFYDPTLGNLLLDMVVSPPNVNAATVTFYAARADAVGIFSRYHNFGNGNIGMGLVTQFEITRATPENLASVIDEAIEQGTLTATRNSIKGWRNQVDVAQQLAEKGNTKGACAILRQLLARIDGSGSLPDAIGGSASPIIAKFIQGTMKSIGC